MDNFWILPEAENDLELIWQYTEENWGAEQAVSYHDGLINIFNLLAENPRMGIERSEFDPLVFSHCHASHVVIYQLFKEGIMVIRVLHESMDIETRLTK